MYLRVYVCDIHIYIHTHIYIYIHTHTLTHTHTHTYIYIYIHTHAHTHTHTHTDSVESRALCITVHTCTQIGVWDAQNSIIIYADRYSLGWVNYLDSTYKRYKEIKAVCVFVCVCRYTLKFYEWDANGDAQIKCVSLIHAQVKHVWYVIPETSTH